MRFGIWPSAAHPWQETLELVQHCERTGWDAVYFADHFMPLAEGPSDGDTLECWSVIAALAAAVPRMRLAPLVASVTYRHPAVTANIAAAVDIISGGRLTLGLGAGWQQNEHEAYGLELGSVKERLDRFDEACQVIRWLTRSPRTTFEGKYFTIRDAPNQPAPVQERLPILIGGGGEKRTLRIAAKYADVWNAWTTPEVLRRKVGILKEHCDKVGRDSRDIEVSTQGLLYMSTDDAWVAEKKKDAGSRPVIVGTPDEVVEIIGLYLDAGADELIVPDANLGTFDERIETCDLFINEVARHFR